MLAASFHLIATALGFDWVDLIILIGVGYAAVRGGKLGAAVQLGSYGGFWLGLLIGAVVAPRIASLVSNIALRSIILIIVLFGFASIGDSLVIDVTALCSKDVHDTSCRGCKWSTSRITKDYSFYSSSDGPI